MLCNTYFNYVAWSSRPEHFTEKTSFCFSLFFRDYISVCEFCCVLIAFVLTFDTDGGPELQRTAAVQKEEKRRLQWGDRGGREAWENPQMYCGESAAFVQCFLNTLCTARMCMHTCDALIRWKCRTSYLTVNTIEIKVFLEKLQGL